MYTLFLALQYIGIVILLFQVIYILSQTPSKLQQYLLIAMIALLKKPKDRRLVVKHTVLQLRKKVTKHTF